MTIVLVLAGLARQLATASETTQLAVIGGLLMATAATLFFVPLIYSLMQTRPLHVTLRKTGSY
jgi:multidrug efflux pump subunit AcrB